MGLKVVKLVAENVKGLKAVEIVPDSNFQVIAGRNGQGKTSVLDSIMLAIGGAAAAKGTARPVRDGADKAISSVDLGDFIVTRKWTSNDKSTLQVVSKDGAKYSSPQKMLDELIGKLSFDPLAFSNLDTKAQLKTLLELVDIDPAPIDEKKKKVYDDRTLVNREVKALKSRLESFGDVDESVPDEEVQASDIIKEMQEAQQIISKNNEMRAEYKKLESEYHQTTTEAANVQQEIDRLEMELENKKRLLKQKTEKCNEIAQKGSELRDTIKNLRDPDMNTFNSKLAEVEEVNKAVRKKKEYQTLIADYQKQARISNDLSKHIQALEDEKQQMIKSANFPIEDLSFDETGVLYKGVPFKQCSAAERLRVSMAMAMALNPELRVIRIMDGSLLDSTNMKLIEEMAKEQDYQVWVEVVDESGKVGITIENGEVKEF